MTFEKYRPKMQDKKDSYVLGLLAEHIVICKLLIEGWSLVYHRLKTKNGEIDIVMENDTTIVFVEVKARTMETASESVLLSGQLNRIKGAINAFIQERIVTKDVRLDVVTFNFPPYLNGRISVDTVENITMYDF